MSQAPLGLAEKPQSQAHDDVYLRIWESQQGWMGSRWTVTTFFLSVSFALFGLSLGALASSNQPDVTWYRLLERLFGLAIYWFTYLLHRRYDDWSKYLRSYLRQMEDKQLTSIRLQTGWEDRHGRFRRSTSVNKLLLYFGILYSLAVLGLLIAGL